MWEKAATPVFVRKTEVRVYPDRARMGLAAALYVRDLIQGLSEKHAVINMVFAAAPSQNEFLDALSSLDGVPWGKVQAFHLDEYIGLPPDAPQRFANYLDEHLFRRVPLKQVFYIDEGRKNAPEALCRRYSLLLEKNPLHIACIGIGENGHIAFNDPHVADFDDPLMVKIVTLDRRSREQQVADGCFSSLEEVPTQAITLTIPAIMAAQYIVCVVPGPRKAEAVRDAIDGPLGTSCPASVLRCHRAAVLFLDRESARLLRR
jgi:glucosamine-6-phosphate deaminase